MRSFTVLACRLSFFCASGFMRIKKNFCTVPSLIRTALIPKQHMAGSSLRLSTQPSPALCCLLLVSVRLPCVPLLLHVSTHCGLMMLLGHRCSLRIDAEVLVVVSPMLFTSISKGCGVPCLPKQAHHVIQRGEAYRHVRPRQKVVGAVRISPAPATRAGRSTARDALVGKECMAYAGSDGSRPCKRQTCLRTLARAKSQVQIVCWGFRSKTKLDCFACESLLHLDHVRCLKT